MLEETYFKFKKNILPKMKKMQPNFQEPVVEYCEPEQVIDICSYNHYPILDDNTSQRADDDDDIQQTEVSHVQLPTVKDKYHVKHDDNTLRKLVYGPTYVPYNEDGQKLLLPQTTDMSRKDNLKLLYNSLPEGMCDNEYESLDQAVNDVETF